MEKQNLFTSNLNQIILLCSHFLTNLYLIFHRVSMLFTLICDQFGSAFDLVFISKKSRLKWL